MNKSVILILIILLILFSSSIGVVIWGASTNWWSPDDEEGTSGSPGPSKAPGQVPSPRGTPGQVPSPSSSVTINNLTFDPSGYTVSKGWFWNRKALGKPDGTGWCLDPVGSTCNPLATDANDCYNKCTNSSTCTHFGYYTGGGSGNVPVGTCFMFEPDLSIPGASNSSSLRGIKRDGTNNYSSSINIDTHINSTPKSISDCISNCNTDNICVGWNYFINDKTCKLFKNGTAPDKYKEGSVLK